MLVHQAGILWKKRKNKIDTIMETLPDNNKRKTTDDSDDEYEDNQVKKKSLTKTMMTTTMLLLLTKDLYIQQADLKKLTPTLRFVKKDASTST